MSVTIKLSLATALLVLLILAQTAVAASPYPNDLNTGAGPWLWVQPDWQGATINSISFADANTGWAVGIGGTILKTTDGGATWNAQNSGTTYNLSSVDFVDSSNGWAVGSVGGIVCLLFILPAIVISKNDPLVVRGSFAFTALFFILSTLPLFLWIKERREGRALPAGETYPSLAMKRLLKTFKAVRRFREFITFIVSFLVYNDGILMALDFAAIIGAVLFGMTQTQLIIFMIIDRKSVV